MKLEFVGADHEVTGSCHYLEAAGKKILVDCGMEQGRDDFVNVPIPVSPGELDYVFVTHAHIDHTGNLPVLVKNGFKGPILSTHATADLCGIMLLDSAHIQEFEAEWRNRKGKRRGQPEFVPSYTVPDAEAACRLFREYDYDTVIDVCDGIKIRFTDVGHLLGSAAIEVWVNEDGKETKIVFSGDIGNTAQPLIRDPARVSDADYLLIESTYGDRNHEARVDYVTELSKIMQRTFDRGGNLVVPSFAVGRTQEMLYFIRQIKEQNLIHGHDGFEVYVDSPLANKATTIYSEHNADCFDEEAEDLVRKGINPIAFPGLKLAVSADESKLINMDMQPKVILSASGMCEAGRIKHHLKHNLWRKESTVLFVGYQAEGTLGRALLEGKKDVTLFGEQITVAAEICNLPGVSGHADQAGLLDWAGGFAKPPKKVFIVHGDDAVVQPFADLLKEKYGWDTMAPYSGTVYDLAQNVCVTEARGIPIEHRAEASAGAAAGTAGETAAAGRAQNVYSRLIAAGNRLLAIIRRSEGHANKDLAKFADQIDALNNKWDA